jgi:hydroxymethylbilane synthase
MAALSTIALYPLTFLDMRLIIGSRGSKLALWQAHWVRDQLAAGGSEIEIQIIKTTGDKLQAIAPGDPLPASMAQTVAEAGSKGLFIKEIEEALRAGEIDVAVHSLKDLPTEQPPGLELGAVPQREDARDVFIARDGRPLEKLPPGARIATSSLRRQTQLRALRPDLVYVAMRGNLDTRLRKLERGDCEALVLAAAGVHRLGLTGGITSYFTFEQMCPAVGQGALGIEVRADDGRAWKAVAPLDHPATHQAVRAERAVLRRLGGGCQVPIAAHAVAEDGHLRLQGLVANLDGTRVIHAHSNGSTSDPEALGAAVAEDLLRQGARQILDSIV